MRKIEDLLEYLAKLHSEEFYVLPRVKYMCQADLTGRRVNFGPAGSGGALTARAIFEASNVQVQPQYLDYGRAAEKLRKGELGAMVFVSGKPSTAFDCNHYTDGVHFLDVDFVHVPQRDYLPAIPAHDDDPDLSTRDVTVSAVAGSAVMAAIKSPPKWERRRKLERFVDRFFTKIDQFQRPGCHPKWRKVRLSATVAGSTRFPAEQQWLKTNPETIAAKTNTVAAGGIDFGRRQNFAGVEKPEARRIKLLFDNYQRSRGSDGAENSEKLSKEFMRWYQKSERN